MRNTARNSQNQNTLVAKSPSLPDAKGKEDKPMIGRHLLDAKSQEHEGKLHTNSRQLHDQSGHAGHVLTVQMNPADNSPSISISAAGEGLLNQANFQIGISQRDLSRLNTDLVLVGHDPTELERLLREHSASAAKTEDE
jgi:hypothetical protein